MGGGSGTGDVPKLGGGNGEIPKSGDCDSGVLVLTSVGGGNGTGEVPKSGDRDSRVIILTNVGGGSGTGDVPKVGGGNGTGEVPKLTEMSFGRVADGSACCGTREHPIATVDGSHSLRSSRPAKVRRSPTPANTMMAARDNCTRRFLIRLSS